MQTVDCEETPGDVEETTATTLSRIISVAAAEADSEHILGEAEEEDEKEWARYRLIISPRPNNNSELVRAVGSSVVFTCHRVSAHHGDGDDDGAHPAAEATSVEWFDKNDMKIPSQTNHR